MTTNPIFKGVATALITPLDANGVNYEQFGKLIDWQIESGINALVIAGTTGEGSTLSDEEHREVLKYAIERIAGRVPAIAGTGSNDTAYAISLTKYACELGYDGMLLVTPYYNKTTQAGLVAMFKAIADESTKPCILYNVPSRTGVNIEPSTYEALKGYPNITAIKEANGNISKIVETFSLIDDEMDLYSGNDDQIVPILSLGGIGVISVLSNIAPQQTHDICQAYFDGDVALAAKRQIEAIPLIDALFCEVNPIPVKKAVELQGRDTGVVRRPLTEMEPQNAERLQKAMMAYGVL